MLVENPMFDLSRSSASKDLVDFVSNWFFFAHGTTLIIANVIYIYVCVICYIYNLTTAQMYAYIYIYIYACNLICGYKQAENDAIIIV